MDERLRLRAGVAAFDAGEYAAARDGWREADSEEGEALADAAAVIVRGRTGSFDGLAADAHAASETLGTLDEKRGVDASALRDYLGVVAGDPEVVERRLPPAIALDGERVTPDDLDIEGVLALAPAVAAASGGERERVERAVEYARADLGEDEAGTSAFVTLCYDVVTDPEARPVAYRRLVERVERREAREKDVEGLFG
ncbi:hypothetical protein J2752_001955 [Halarchaeum rubridurum]|uniref:DUF309 domain-containing protein n=1 Tax=Halarchaeum rubridurum TaxID=489911 RepID=A0A830G0K7_9EURY|nr:DUF309 domain-containing protein [Halarchaeum rubridurum]MBP1955043.1 hypothetical protein [Halarchaeum rubridurum]GGM69418.1 hypothetical protein GCM10009017_19500 [Halarchaeum rubridurum]